MEKKTNAIVPISPDIQSMERSSAPMELTKLKGVVIRQETQMMEAGAAIVGLPWEAKNRYKISALEDGQKVATSPSDPHRWQPDASQLRVLPVLMKAHEESDVCQRIVLNALGCGNLRNLKLHMFAEGNPSQDIYTHYRPLQLGAWICCPVTSTIHDGASGRVLGRAMEDCSPSNYCIRAAQVLCLCTSYTRVDLYEEATSSFRTKYRIVTNMCCCGPHNNFCGGTCFKNDAVFNIVDENDRVVAHIQKTFGGGGDSAGAVCRCMMQFSNYALSFPDDATEEERALLLTALFQIEYLLFEKSGNENS